MAKHLTEDEVNSIVEIIRGWPDEKMTWEKVCASALQVAGRKISRQTLEGRSSIKEAFQSRKKGLVKRAPRVQNVSSIAIATQRIDRLMAENDELKAANDRLMEQFIVWECNAYKRGLKRQDLYEPLPAIDRERTEEKVQNGPQRTGRRSS